MSQLVDFEVTLESPLFIATRRQARVPDCLDHIPGSTLRGAILAAHYRLAGPDDDLLALLDSETNRFPFLYPGPAGTVPVPRSVVSCKRGCSGRVLDDQLLARRAAREMRTEAAFAELESRSICQACGEDQRPVGGYWCEGKLRPLPIKTQRMNVGIDRRTGTAHQGVLFGTVALEPILEDGTPAVFTGRGLLDARSFERVEALCEEPLFLGKYRSRGFGRISLALRPVQEQQAAKRRYDIEKGCRNLKKAVGWPGGELFTLDLVSPLVAYDRFLRTTAEPTCWLPEALRAEAIDVVIARRVVSGWDLGAGLPKDDEQAVAAGSVVLAKSELSRAELVERLVGLEREGLGERRGEGLGQVLVNGSNRFEEVRS